MKKIALLLAGIILLGNTVRAESVPALVAATVNGEVITEDDLDRQVQAWTSSYSDLGEAPPATKLREVRLEKLNVLIDRALIIQAFYREGNEVPDRLVDGRLNEIVTENYGGDRAAFDQTLVERGITVQKYRQEIADNYIIGQMRNRHDQVWFASLRKDAAIKIH